MTFLRLMRENLDEGNVENDATSFEVSVPKMYESNNVVPQQMQNADLAEADQSCVDVDEEDCEEENNEGAVGGLVTDRGNSNTPNQVRLFVFKKF